MYSVVKHQVLSTAVENKTFSRKRRLYFWQHELASSEPTKTKLKRSELPVWNFESEISNLNTGGDDRSRTCDPLNANQVLSQLSYIPISIWDCRFRIRNFKIRDPQSQIRNQKWLRGQDLNLRPLGYEPNELPDCSTPRWNGGPG